MELGDKVWVAWTGLAVAASMEVVPAPVLNLMELLDACPCDEGASAVEDDAIHLLVPVEDLVQRVHHHLVCPLACPCRQRIGCAGWKGLPA